MNDAQQQTPVFNIQRMYLSDMSLEIPGAPQIFLEQAQPAVEIQLDTETANLAEGVYQVSVRVTVTTRAGSQVAFLVEAKQCGIFEIRNFPEEQMELILGIACPSIVYPYLRSNVADIVQRSSFPPVHLAEINWEVFYQQRQAAQAQGANGQLPQ